MMMQPFLNFFAQVPRQNPVVESIHFQQPPPPPDAPKKRSRGAGSRGGCMTADREVTLIPIIPRNSWGDNFSSEANPLDVYFLPRG